MKSIFKKKQSYRKGSIVILFIFAIGLTCFAIAFQFFRESAENFALAKSNADGFKAKLIAQAGLQAAISALQAVPEDMLFKSGFIHSPPDINVEGCRPSCFISYRIQPENGKINVNNLMRSDDRPSVETREILERLFVHFQIPIQTVDSIIDWLDENNSIEGAGAEAEYYKSLTPGRKIKNYRLFSLSELCSIKGINYTMLYTSRAPEGWLENQKELSFQTDIEKEMLTGADWILSNHLTAYLETNTFGFEKININTARYHVLLSLSDSMTSEAVKALFTLRKKRDYYISDLSEISEISEFQVTTASGKTLYEEIAGTGGDLSGLITTKGTIYRITGIGSIINDSDNNKAVVRSMSVLFNMSTKKIIFYSED